MITYSYCFISQIAYLISLFMFDIVYMLESIQIRILSISDVIMYVSFSFKKNIQLFTLQIHRSIPLMSGWLLRILLGSLNYLLNNKSICFIFFL